MKIAVIGSGIAGLSCSWLLSQSHEVTLFERASALGMDAYRLDATVAGQALSIDVPVRVSSPFYYPNLFRLYEHLGVEMQHVEYGSSFVDGSGSGYFHYRSVKAGSLNLPVIRPSLLLSHAGRQIGFDVLRFAARSSTYLQQSRGTGETLQQFMERLDFSDAFVHRFICPVLSALCSCSYETALAYPAEIVLDVFAGGFLQAGLYRVRKGSQQVVETLTQGTDNIRLSTSVVSVEREGEQMRVQCSDGEVAHFDHVVVSTQTNHALHFLKDLPDAEREVLQSFRYGKVQILNHTDPSYMPRDPALHSTLNYQVDPARPLPMITMWVNRIQPDFSDKPAVYQTINPFTLPAEDKTLSLIELERPSVDAAAMQAQLKLAALQRKTEGEQRRLWFCGSYADYGVPLQESATSSALWVAEQISGRARPWEVLRSERLRLDRTG